MTNTDLEYTHREATGDRNQGIPHLWPFKVHHQNASPVASTSWFSRFLKVSNKAYDKDIGHNDSSSGSGGDFIAQTLQNRVPLR